MIISIATINIWNRLDVTTRRVGDLGAGTDMMGAVRAPPGGNGSAVIATHRDARGDCAAPVALH